MKKIAWVLGWAVPAEWFAAEAARAWPQSEHLCVPAAPDWRASLEALPDCDAIGGYSLGSLLLLSARGWVAERWSRVGLLAPIWAFPAEEGRGGRVRRAEVRGLARRVRSDAARATADFHRWAGLGSIEGGTPPAETLIWGLEKLETCSADAGLPAGWSAFAGEKDVLLDADVLSRGASGLRVVAGAGHAPGPLLAAWAEESVR